MHSCVLAKPLIADAAFERNTHIHRENIKSIAICRPNYIIARCSWCGHDAISPRAAGDIAVLWLSSHNNTAVTLLSSKKTKLVTCAEQNQMSACFVQHVSHANT